MSQLRSTLHAARLLASMRPGQAAPDELSAGIVAGLGVSIASMRPGQAAPDEEIARSRMAQIQTASMRPGQAAPDEMASAG